MSELNLENIKEEAEQAVLEILEQAKLQEGDIFLVGCSTSEIAGMRIGQGSSMQVAEAVFDAIWNVLKERKIHLAAQCCEHLNRCIIMDRAALKPWQEIVNVVPQLHAGSAFATTAYAKFSSPVALETIKADAGMDIGDTFIGMHLKEVAVPLRISVKSIGNAHLTSARTRPKYIGGDRACYDMALSGGEIRTLPCDGEAGEK